MKLIIFGTGGHAESTLDLAIALKYDIQGYIDPETPLRAWNGLPVFQSISEIDIEDSLTFVLGLGSISIRKRVVAETIQFFPGATFPTLIHPTAQVSNRARIGFGSCIFANSYVGPGVTIGNYCIINTASCIEHNSRIEDHVVVGPGVIVGGTVEIGKNAMIGIGAVVSNQVKIGEDSVVGGNSYVNSNIPSNVVAYGTPARIIRKSDN
jgi:sugar O-acyltransferase (sialic acid O-acetyltransferase NeuD family)